MTMHIQMLYEVAKHAKAMADAMQAIVEDCAEQLALRKAAGESEDDVMNEAFCQPDVKPQEEPASEPEKPAAPEKPKLTIVELRAFVAERSTPETRPKIKAILTKYGVKKLTELPESKYEAVREEVAAL